MNQYQTFFFYGILIQLLIYQVYHIFWMSIFKGFMILVLDFDTNFLNTFIDVCI